MNTSVTNTSMRARMASKHIALTAIGAATLTLLGVNASAATAAKAPSQEVDFQGLDLSKSADAKLLYRRLKMAASEVCVGYPLSRGIERNTPRVRCEQAAITNAVETIDNPNLTALHVKSAKVKLAQGKMQPASHS